VEKKQGPKVLNVEIRVHIELMAHKSFESYFGRDLAQEDNFYLALMNGVNMARKKNARTYI
jgi:hypothetical protein